MFRISENSVSEEQVMFPSSSGVDLYGVVYHARDEEKGAIVICHPDGDERTWSHRILVNLARLLASHGYTVLRFDYMGQGESEGEYEQGTLSTRVNDTRSAIELLLARTHRTEVGLLGLRLGGTLAALVGTTHSAVTHLVLWEPILDLHAHLYNLLRINISFQMVMHKTVLKNREQLAEEILSGGMVSINGFYLAKEFFRESMETKLEGIFQRANGKRLIVLLPNSSFPADGDGTVLRLQFPVFWKEPKVYHSRPKTLMEETLKWITTNCTATR